MSNNMGGVASLNHEGCLGTGRIASGQSNEEGLSFPAVLQSTV